MEIMLLGVSSGIAILGSRYDTCIVRKCIAIQNDFNESFHLYGRGTQREYFLYRSISPPTTDLSPRWKHVILSLLVLLLINCIVPLN